MKTGFFVVRQPTCLPAGRESNLDHKLRRLAFYGAIRALGTRKLKEAGYGPHRSTQAPWPGLIR
jgi:hypothetical protein